MTQYRVYRDGKTESVTADGYYIRDNCLTMQRYEHHAADLECDCENYHRLDDDSQPRAHRCTVDLVSYAADYWRRIELVDA